MYRLSSCLPPTFVLFASGGVVGDGRPATYWHFRRCALVQTPVAFTRGYALYFLHAGPGSGATLVSEDTKATTEHVVTVTKMVLEP
jgi:hypothetical protein